MRIELEESYDETPHPYYTREARWYRKHKTWLIAILFANILTEHAVDAWIGARSGRFYGPVALWGMHAAIELCAAGRCFLFVLPMALVVFTQIRDLRNGWCRDIALCPESRAELLRSRLVPAIGMPILVAVAAACLRYTIFWLGLRIPWRQVAGKWPVPPLPYGANVLGQWRYFSPDTPALDVGWPMVAALGVVTIQLLSISPRRAEDLTAAGVIAGVAAMLSISTGALRPVYHGSSMSFEVAPMPDAVSFGILLAISSALYFYVAPRFHTLYENLAQQEAKKFGGKRVA